MGARVRMLGQPNVVEHSRVLDLPAGKTSALLYYLAYRRDWVERDALLGLLYLESDERRAHQNLRALIARARRLAAGREMDVEATRLRWQVPTDVAMFQTALTEGRWAAAVETYGGPFLEGFVLPNTNAYQEWLEAVREDLAGGWREASLRLGTSLCEHGRYPEAARLAERLCIADPFDEVALRLRVAALTRDGRKAVALAAYESFAAFMEAELGVQPAQATMELADAVRRGSDLEAMPWGAWDQAQERAIDILTGPGRPSLPRPATSFIGRERELMWLRERLSDAGFRLATLVGPGGMGKTALALEFGRRLEHDGVSVLFVPLETAVDVQDAASLIGGAIGLTLFGRDAPEHEVVAALRRRDDVFILDNVEQIDGFPAFVHAIVEAAANVKLVVTSRKRLDLGAEWALEVGGLSHGERAGGDAARLFAAAAARVDAAFQPAAHQADVGRICRLVGGMPLALELAAGWLPVLGPSEIAERLESDLEILQGEAADRPARHRAMVVVLEETWSGLPAPERRGLAALAVFVDGFTVQAAESVVGVGPDVLRSLSRSALIRRAPDGRFRQHPLVWRFARRRAAEQDGWETLRARHARHYLNLMARIAAVAATRPDEPPRAHSADFANALDAWSYTVDHGGVDLLASAIEGLKGLAIATAMTSAGAAAVERAIQVAGGDDSFRGRLLRVQGQLLSWSGEYECARAALEAGLVLAERVGDHQEQGLGHFALGLVTAFSNTTGADLRPALKLSFAKSLEHFREQGDRYYQARALANLAGFEDDAIQREAWLQTAIEEHRSSRGHFGLTLALHLLAMTVRDTQGAYEEACGMLDEAVEIERSMGLPFRLAWWLASRADVRLDQGRLDEAERDLREAGAITETLAVGRGAWEADHVAVGLARLDLARGQRDRAAEAFDSVARGESGHVEPPGYRLSARCWYVVAQGRAGHWEVAEQAALVAVRSPHWWMVTEEHAWAPEGAGVVGVLVEASARRREAVAARETLGAFLPVVRKFRLLPAALELCLAASRLHVGSGVGDGEDRLLDLAAHHPAAAAHTRAEALRRLAGRGGSEGVDRGIGREGTPRDRPSTAASAESLEDVLVVLDSTAEA